MLKTKFFLMILLLATIVNSNVLDVKLLGTRKDITFLSIEGDILRPLKYEFEDRDIKFVSIDLDSSNNWDQYKDIIMDAGGKLKLPILLIDEKILTVSEINKDKVSKIIDRRAFRKDKPKRVKLEKKDNKALKNVSVKPTKQFELSNENMTYTNIFVAIVIVIGGVVVYYARKNLLK